MSLAEPLLRKEDRGNEERLPAEEPPEDAASWVSQLLFWWVGPAIVLPAFRRGHVRLEHLPPSSRVDNPSPLEKAFHNRWTRALEAARAAGASAAAAATATASATSSSFSSPSLVAVLWRLHWRAFVLSGLLLLLSQICQFGIPYILELFLTELEEPLDGPDSDSLRTSFSLAAALYGASVLRSLLVHQVRVRGHCWGTREERQRLGAKYACVAPSHLVSSSPILSLARPRAHSSGSSRCGWGRTRRWNSWGRCTERPCASVRGRAADTTSVA